MISLIKKAKMLAAATTIGVLASPVAPDVNTIALWKFDETGTVLSDSISSGQLPGVDLTSSLASSVPSVSYFGASFGNARNFSALNAVAYSNLISGTKLDFKGKTEVSVSAMVYLTSISPGVVSIFDNREIQLLVENNHLAGYVRQTSGFKGAVAKNSFNLNTGYRVGLHLKNGYLSISIDDQIVGNVSIDEPIAAAESDARLLIGGDGSSRNFPGVVDDVTISKMAAIDNVPPQIKLISPDFSVPQIEASPFVQFEIVDDSGFVNENSIKVTLNSNIVSGLVYDQATHLLSGHLSQPLVAGKKNVIGIEASDVAGNVGRASYEISFIAWGSGEEYVSDAATLGLWHLNDYGLTWAEDSSSYKRNGRIRRAQAAPGIIGQSRYFSGGGNGIDLPAISIPENRFTLEAWVKPLDVGTYSSTIFDNNQVVLKLISGGGVRVVLNTANANYTYSTPLNQVQLGVWSHVKVVFDGSVQTDNLIILVNGLIAQSFTVPQNCDLNDDIALAKIGQDFNGFIDEVRLSSIVRESVNLIRGQAPRVDIAYPLNNSTVRSANLNFLANLFDEIGIDTQKIELKLNGTKVSGQQLQVSNGRVSAALPSALKLGVNEIEMRVTGKSNNQTLIQRRFFYIPDGSSGNGSGLSEYEVDQSTVGLWHMNDSDPTTALDSTGKLNLNSPFMSVAQGVLGNGKAFASEITTASFKLPGRAFTIETWAKLSPSSDAGGLTQNIFRLNGSSMNLSLSWSKTTLSLMFYSLNSTQNGNLNIEIPSVVKDFGWHHYAFVYDGLAPHSNVLLLIDGTVQYRADLRSKCVTCDVPVTMTLGANKYQDNQYAIDEVRLSNVARNGFNVGIASGPTIGISSPALNETVHISNPPVKIAIQDSVGLDSSSTKLYVNGIQDTSIVPQYLGDTATIDSALGISLNPGANSIKIVSKNLNGTQTVNEYLIFYVSKGPSAPYSVDASESNTVGLWHFDSNGVLTDSSGNGFNMTPYSGGSPVTTSGVFGTALNATSSFVNTLNYNVNSDALVSQWTWEGWINLTGSYVQSLWRVAGSDVVSVTSSGEVSFCPASNGISCIKSPVNTIMPGKFQHIAVITDGNNLIQKNLIVVDGNVVAYGNSSGARSFSGGMMSLGYSYVDEIRLSKTARYTLNYSAPNSVLLRMFKKSHLSKR